MGGSNPYHSKPHAEKPTQSFTITYLPQGQVVTVEPDAIPSSGTGLPGSLLDIALASGIDIDHACGGVCACSTCHVMVQEGLDSCSESTEEEEDQLEKAPGLSSRSRLACQCVPNGRKNLVVEIPHWNRNLVRE
ncbi:MAG: 2Fe-2S iron-sulfur cluster-binding protein [Bdellovibrionia bacterium]